MRLNLNCLLNDQQVTSKGFGVIPILRRQKKRVRRKTHLLKDWEETKLNRGDHLKSLALKTPKLQSSREKHAFK